MGARRTLVWLLGVVLAPVANAETIAGVCPDGSVFIVQSRSAIPCSRARTAEPSELPPLNPQMLPRPYTWYVDQEERNPNNPYNALLDAQRMRAARRGAAETETAPPEPTRHPAREAVVLPELPPEAPTLALSDDDLRNLVRLVALRQQVSPAELRVDDIHGNDELRIQFAYSGGLQRQLVAEGADADQRVVLFAAIARRGHAFRPNFLVVQDGATHRPDPGEVQFLVGAPGEIPAGAMALGYFTVPGRFDLTQPMSLYWNDRSLDGVVLGAP